MKAALKCLAMFAMLCVAAPAVAGKPVYPAYTQSDNLYYVSPSGTGSCTASSRCNLNTALEALKQTPLLLHKFEIDLAAGTYTDCIDLWAAFPKNPSGGAYLYIHGPAMSLDTIAAGPTSGTATASTVGTWPTHATISDALAAWGLDDLRGRYLCLGASCANGIWPIETNSDTVIRIAGGALGSKGIGNAVTGLGGAIAYSIVKNTAILTGKCSVVAPASYPISVSTSGVSTGVAGDFQLGINTLAGPMREFNVMVERLEFKPGSSTRSVRIGAGGAAILRNVTFTPTSNASGVSCYSGECRAIVQRSSFRQDSGSGAFGVLGTQDGNFTNLVMLSNVFKAIGSNLASSARILSLVAVHNYAFNMTDRTWAPTGVVDGYIGADISTGGTSDYVFWNGKNAMSANTFSSWAIDGVNWSMAGVGQCAMIESAGYYRWDDSGTSSNTTDGLAAKTAAICVGSNAFNYHLVEPFLMFGAGSNIWNWATGGTSRTSAQLAAAGNKMICDPLFGPGIAAGTNGACACYSSGGCI